jgi:hypothetical protein
VSSLCMLRNGPAREAQSMLGESIVQTAVTPLIDSLGVEEKVGGKDYRRI